MKKNHSTFENDFQNSKKSSEYRNRSKQTSEEAKEILEKIKIYFNDSENIKQKLLNNKKEIDENYLESEEIKKKLDLNASELAKMIVNLEQTFEKHPDLSDEIIKFESEVEEIDELNTKIKSIYNNSITRKKEIDELYFSIIWYTNTDTETWDEEKIEWLKDKLESMYLNLQSNIKDTQIEVDSFKISKETELEVLVDNTTSEYNTLKDEWENKFTILEKSIRDLLPDALTAWLSGAYSTKKNEEKEELGNLIINFYWGIWLLIWVSLIPIIVSIIFLFKEVPLEEVILRLPRLVLSILPLYLPVWWFAFYTNKRLNLSKRLIEEYTHKEVLSKTFEWLSTQINDLEDSEISKELKVKLLINILEVSSENPWKLISDYNSSDHPIIDALNKSEKLAKSINKLEKIPWINKIADFLKTTTEKVVQKKEDEIIEVIDDITKLKK